MCTQLFEVQPYMKYLDVLGRLHQVLPPHVRCLSATVYGYSLLMLARHAHHKRQSAIRGSVRIQVVAAVSTT